ncbi:MAG: HAD family phosphatase [Lachnospiraceae bacterium]|nr:HAD family phosphatase [Lachnospiraceae bacterium]
MKNNEHNSRYTPLQRMAALIGAACLAALSLSALGVALFGGPERTGLVFTLLAAAVFAPILIFLFAWALGKAPGGPGEQNGPERAEQQTSAAKTGTADEGGRIDTVVFDIGGVLVGFDYRDFIAGKGYDPEMTERIIAATVHSPWWQEYDRGVMTDEEILRHFCDGAPEIAGEIRSTFADIRGMITRREESIPWIRALKTAGYKVLVLSNYSQKALDDCPEAVDFLEEVDGGILSFRDHVIKPDPAIYELLAGRYALVPGRTVFVDDTPENVEAAVQLGWHGIVWESRAQVEEELHRLGIDW